MATRPEDVEAARGGLESDLIILTPNGMSNSYRMVDAEDLRTILASHAELTKNLQRRDDFIVDRGLWPDFVDQLPSGKASA